MSEREQELRAEYVEAYLRYKEAKEACDEATKRLTYLTDTLDAARDNYGRAKYAYLKCIEDFCDTPL